MRKRIDLGSQTGSEGRRTSKGSQPNAVSERSDRDLGKQAAGYGPAERKDGFARNTVNRICNSSQSRLLGSPRERSFERALNQD